MIYRYIGTKCSSLYYASTYKPILSECKKIPGVIYSGDKVKLKTNNDACLSKDGKDLIDACQSLEIKSGTTPYINSYSTVTLGDNDYDLIYFIDTDYPVYTLRNGSPVHLRKKDSDTISFNKYTIIKD